MASLANQTISSSYDGLIKTSSDNAVPVSGVQALEDGSGNALALSVGRSGNGVTVSGNLAVDTNTLYVDAANNRVGIGMTPNEKLSIKNAINTPAIEIVPSTDNNNADTAVLRLWGTVFGTANRYSEIRNVTDGSTANNDLAFNTNGSEKMRIDSSGNVGIGVVPSNARLDVKTSGNQSIYGSTTGGWNVLEFTSDDGTTVGGLNAYNGIIKIGTANAIGGVTGAINIDSSGRVGIGTSSPDTNLHISSAASTPTVKIESTHPSGIPFLDLKGAAASQIRYIDETGTIQTRIDFTDNGGVSFVDVAGSASSRMSINSSGNVKIGSFGGATSVPLEVYKQSPASGTMLSLKNALYGSTDASGLNSIEFGWFNHSAAKISANKESVNRTGFIITGEVGYNTPVEIARFLSTGGLTFNGDTAAANALDDYEEGTFTPTLGGTWITNPTNIAGNYIKIGKMVFIRLQFTGGVKVSSTTGWFDGLPFSGAEAGGGTVSNVSVDNKGIVLLDNSTRIWLTATDFGGIVTKVMASYLLP